MQCCKTCTDRYGGGRLACIDTRADCLVVATVSYCQNRYDYLGGRASRYDYLGGMQCCKTCTDRYGGGRLGPLGPLPLIPNEPLGRLPLIPNACIDTRADCLVVATVSYCQNRYDYLGGIGSRYHYLGGMQCCKTCTELYG